MKNTIHLIIMTSDGVRYEREADYVGLPLESGAAGILPGHAPLMASLGDGPVKCRSADGTEYVCVGRGVVDVRSDQVSVLTRSAEKGADIDLDRAAEAERRARERLAARKGAQETAMASEALSRALARQKTFRLSHSARL